MIGVSERINIDDGFITVGEPIPNKIAADEARAAGNKYRHSVKSSKGHERALTQPTGCLDWDTKF